MSEELKPCPFCGETPDLPSGDGTYYVIECRECGGAVVGIQISDLMTIEERQSDPFTDYRYAEQFIERAKAKAAERWNTRATPPAAQVQGEREGFEAWQRSGGFKRPDDPGEWEAWQARAALSAPPAAGVPKPDVRQVVTEAFVGLVSAVTSMSPPPNEPLPDFIQAPIDRAVERIEAALLPTPPAPTVGARPQTCNGKRCGWCKESAEPCHYTPSAAGAPDARSFQAAFLTKRVWDLAAELEALKEQKPVAWGVPNTRITESHPFVELLQSTDGCQYPEMLVPLYAAPTPPASEQQQAVVLPDLSAMRYHADKIYRRVDEGAKAYEDGKSGLGCMEDAAESALYLRGKLDELLRLNPHLAGVNQGVTEAGNGGEA